MKLLSWIYIFALPALLVVAEAETKEPPKELVIETTYMPEECTMKPELYEKIEVHYTGRLFSDGTVFDSSLDRGTPISLKLGAGQVIRGWDEGLKDMCLHEKRKLTIPSHKAYGKRGFGNVIPPDATLIFDVELVSIDKPHNRDEL